MSSELETETNVEIILRQTTLTREEAIAKLTEYNNDYVKVIKNFMGIPEKPAPKIVSVNQQIYKEIRTVFNEASQNFRNSRE